MVLALISGAICSETFWQPLATEYNVEDYKQKWHKLYEMANLPKKGISYIKVFLLHVLLIEECIKAICTKGHKYNTYALLCERLDTHSSIIHVTKRP